ncbi:KAP family P-loop NTPase fold protein [Rhizobium leguminosarum]|uniref:KAP family P-loop NTPase fold protein n=1 Tax=Rhizobium leguminosarum TaxID=384 RepID=UPI0013EE85FC|nr:P-loop NTPase fold protein [Rhizobium leguminosarum]
MAKERYKLGEDIPKENPWRDDRLGAAPFAKRIAATILSIDAPNGYVIGLHGKWGSGKSSVLNFVLAVVNKHNQETETDQITHIDFRPWLVSGHQDLIVAFFKILSEALGPKEKGVEGFLKRSAKALDGTTDSLVNAAATVALTVDPTGGSVSGFAGDLAKKGVKSLIGRFLEDPSLQAAYERLKAELKASKRRFLVTVDDIDRLEPGDIRSIMQMVKSIGKLPNVVYLLSYDRDLVWHALDGTLDRIGPRYAEKIVQQELELPTPKQNALLSLLDQEIGFLTDAIPDETRWHYIIRDGIQRWIKTPRDVVRLANAVKFAWPGLENEIDRADLLAMEGLRLFDTAVFNWVRENRDLLFSEGRFAFADANARTPLVDQLKRRLKDGEEAQVLHLLSTLFPQGSKWLEDVDFDREGFFEVDKRRGIASQAGYDSYFGLHPSTDAISKTLIDEIMARLGDYNFLSSTIRTYLDRFNSRRESMLGNLLEQLRFHFRGPQMADPTPEFLRVLMDMGEAIIQRDFPRHMFELAPDAQLAFLVRSVLAAWGPAEAGKQLQDAFMTSGTVSMLADVYVDRGRELGVFESTSRERPVIEMETFDALGPVLLRKIEDAARNNSLADAPFFFDIVRAWVHLGGADEAKAWLSNGIGAQPEFLTKVGRGLVNYSVGTATREYTFRGRPDAAYDLAKIATAADAHLLNPALSDDQRKVIDALKRGISELDASEDAAREIDAESL